MNQRTVIALLIFSGLALVSGPLNHVPLLPFLIGVRRILLFIIFAYLLTRIRIAPDFIRKYQRVLLLVLAVQPGIAILQFVTYQLGLNPANTSQIDSALGTFAIKNGTATVALFIIFLIFQKYHETAKIFTPQNTYFILAFLLTFSGGSYVLLAFATFYTTILYPDVGNKSRRLAFGVFFGVALMLMLLGSESVRQSFNLEKRFTTHQAFWSDVSRYGDLASIAVVASEIHASPTTLLLGTGPGNFSLNRVSGYVSDYVDRYERRGNLPTGENSLALLLAEYGYLGTLVFTWMLILQIRYLRQKYRMVEEEHLKAVYFGLIVFAVCYLIGMPYRNYIISLPETFFLWVFPVLLDKLPEAQPNG